MPHAQQQEALAELAALYGVQLDYWDVTGTQRRPSDEAVVAVLAALGADVADVGDLPDAARERRRVHWSRLAGPVAAVFAGETAEIPLRVPAWATGPARATLTLEDGTQREIAFELGSLPIAARGDVDGEERRELRLALPDPLPVGYHELRIETGGEPADVLVVAAPRHAPGPPRPRTWGVFLPLYALHSERTLGLADLADVEQLLAAVDGFGGSLVGSTPLLAAFPHEPSPYAPASRLFWNEAYADLTASPELERSSAARELLESSSYRATGRALATSELVDYRATHELRRPVLEALANTLFSEPSRRREAFDEYLKANPGLADYARFRATGEAEESGWPVWPQAARDGTLSVGADDPAVRYHLYAQWLVDEQLLALARRDGAGLYLDQPLGVHADSYDTWRERGSFALGASGGAPPDQFFSEGQEWGFPPMHPHGIREDRLRYPIACVRRLLGRSRALRIDHVMGLHRLFWVPRGFSAADGVYVSYPKDELYAILCLEAERAGTMLVGEDLGTVEPWVREYLSDRGLLGTSILWFELERDGPNSTGGPLQAQRWREYCMSSVTTHDLPPTAGYLAGEHVRLRQQLGLLTRPAGEELADDRAEQAAWLDELRRVGLLDENPDIDQIVLALYRYLGRTPSRVLGLALADAVGDLRTQNQPGTTDEYPNWRIPLSGPDGRRLLLEDVFVDPRSAALCEALRAAVNPQV